MTTAVSLAQGASNNVTMRNRIINGNMLIDQRNAGALVTSASTWITDRWGDFNAGSGRYSAQQSTTAPTGFPNSLLHTVTTAVTAAAGDVYQVFQAIEGLNVPDLAWGTANAKTITLSFWVRSSIAGTYPVAIKSYSGSSRSYVATYTISTANTFEYKTITIPGCTDGTWPITNNGFCYVTFDLGSGSNQNTTAGAWQNGDYRRTSTCVNWMATSGATFYFTGVQFEVGTVATPFEQRAYSTEFQFCQRYCRVVRAGDSYSYLGPLAVFETTTIIEMPYPINGMRTPAMSWTVSGNIAGEEGGGVLTSAGIGLRGNEWVRLSWTAGGAGTIGMSTAIRSNNDTSAKMTLDCEL